MMGLERGELLTSHLIAEVSPSKSMIGSLRSEFIHRTAGVFPTNTIEHLSCGALDEDVRRADDVKNARRIASCHAMVLGF